MVNLQFPFFRPVLMQMMSAVASKTIQAVQSAPNPSNFSELIADAFQNFVQLLKKHPTYFGAPPQQPGVDTQGLFGLAVACLRLPESAAVRNATAYLTHLVTASATHGAGNPVLASVVRGSGLSMVKEAVVVAVTSDLATDNVEFMSGVFFYLGKHYFNELCAWLQQVVQEDGFPGPAITRDKKEEFANNVVKEKGNKRRLQEVVKDFAATCISLQGVAGRK